MKYKLLLACFFLSPIFTKAQNPPVAFSFPKANNLVVQAKNYYLLTQIEQNPQLCSMLATDPELATLLKNKLSYMRSALSSCKDGICIAEALKFTDDEINTVGAELLNLYQADNALGKLVNGPLTTSGAYSLYDKLDKKQLLAKAWQQDADGINHTIAVYAEGDKPNYPAIDSIGFKVHDKAYALLANNITNMLLSETENTKLFFIPSLTAALTFLDLNDRNNIADYEPMALTVNKAAVTKAATVKWAAYPYPVIVVPGEGPEESGVSIAAYGMLRCRLAADAYWNGMAPFIMVSGGKVHPYKTKYCEAEEMKRYLMHNLNIPESAILMEPHARHTTTNMRNAVRLIYQYHLQPNKPAVVISDQQQSAYITGMEARCLKELQYVPYRLGKRLSPTAQEFYPVWQAMQINALEPLDP